MNLIRRQAWAFDGASSKLGAVLGKLYPLPDRNARQYNFFYQRLLGVAEFQPPVLLNPAAAFDLEQTRIQTIVTMNRIEQNRQQRIAIAVQPAGAAQIAPSGHRLGDAESPMACSAERAHLRIC